MNVQITHNGTDITTYVTNYTREQNICTSICLFDIQITSSCPRTFNPGDTLVLYEGGDKKGTYYCSIIAKEEDGSFYSINAQDGSKRLSDYFIATNYLVNYPSTSKYWISKFLTEAQVSYTYEVSDSGQLLSNNTSLGMQPCYEQILQLLQMSGWYMYFDADNTAHIGNLNKDVDDIADDLEREDILNIRVLKHDQMLRNRAVVWGTADPITGSWVFANLQTITKWNYCAKDLRAVVVSNSNIPNVSTAYSMAKKILTEFARISVEKEIDVHGARNIEIGDFVYVNSDIYHGAGLVTSLGSTLSSDGLITNMILDQRCPRLFGYFDWGDYVYASTWGAGVWRKHIQYDPTWYNYSTGLTELSISDLYKNNNLLSCVTESGNAYYSKDFIGAWYQIPGTTEAESVVSSGVDGVEYAVFSGVKVRGTVHDWSSNRIRMVADNRQEPNTQDFTVRPVISSGLYNSYEEAMLGSTRAWVLDYAPGGTMNKYPISITGEYNLSAYSIANDGGNDFVSVLKPSEQVGTTTVGGLQVAGFAETQQFASTSAGPNFSLFTTIKSGYVGDTPLVSWNLGFASSHGEALATYDEYDFKGAAGGYATTHARLVTFVMVSGLLVDSVTTQVPMVYDEIYAVHRLSNTIFRYLIKISDVVRMYEIDFEAKTATIDFSIDVSAINYFYEGTKNHTSLYRESMGDYDCDLTDHHQNSHPRVGNMYYMVAQEVSSYGVKLKAYRFNLHAGSYDIYTFVNAQGGVDSGTGVVTYYKVQTPPYSTERGQALIGAYGSYGPFFEFILIKDQYIDPCPTPGHESSDLWVMSEAWLYMAFGHGFGVTQLDYNQYDYTGGHTHTSYNVGWNYIAEWSKTINTYYTGFQTFWYPGASTGYFGYPYNFTRTSDVEEDHLWRMDTGSYNPTTAIVYESLTALYYLKDYATGSVTPITLPGWFQVHAPCVHVDEYTKEYYIYGRTVGAANGWNYGGVLSIGSDGNPTGWYPFYGYDNSNISNTKAYCYINGGFLVLEEYNAWQVYPIMHIVWGMTKAFYVYHAETRPTPQAGGLILRRDYDANFTVVYSGGPAKLEISQSYPMVVIGSGATSTYILDSFNINPSGMFTAVPLPMTVGASVQDGRYSNFTNSLTSEDYSRQLLVTASGEIKIADITTLSDIAYNSYYTPPSGGVDQLEVTNFKLPDQYVFVSSPAVPPNFWQKNPTVSGTSIYSGFLFTDYSSGLPSAHITKIRTDDKI